MAKFNQAELGTIAHFFGLPTVAGFDLPEHYTQEDWCLDHPSGDKLEVTEDKYIVGIVNDSNVVESTEFNRDFPGFVLALERFTLRHAGSSSLVSSRTNREWATTEEADLSCAVYVGVSIEVFDNMAWFTSTSEFCTHQGAQVFATGDNEYIVHGVSAAEIYVTNSLKDAMDMAAEFCITT
jgi:hypothetical protein